MACWFRFQRCSYGLPNRLFGKSVQPVLRKQELARIPDYGMYFTSKWTSQRVWNQDLAQDRYSTILVVRIGILNTEESRKLTLTIRFLGSFFIVALTTVAASNPHQPAKFVFATFLNQTGWNNSFVVFMNG